MRDALVIPPDRASSAASARHRPIGASRPRQRAPAERPRAHGTRLLPQIGLVAQALGQDQRGEAAEGLRQFVAEIAELRLRAPFEPRVVLASEAECLHGVLEPTTAS